MTGIQSPYNITVDQGTTACSGYKACDLFI